MFYRQRSYASFYALAGGALLMALVFQGHQAQQEKENPFGKMTAQQVIAEAAPLCQAIAPQTKAFMLSAEASRGPFGNYWQVACQEPTGKEVAYLTWDADTNRLYRLGSWALTQDKNDKSPLTQQEAIRSARYWVKTLHLAQDTSKWRVARPLLRARNHWIVYLEGEASAEKLLVMVRLDARSGDIIHAIAEPSP